MMGDELNGLVQVLRFQDEHAAKLLLRLDERPVGHEGFAVFEAHGRGGPCALQPFPAEKVPLRAQHLVIAETGVQERIAFRFRQRFELFFVPVT